MSRQTPEERYYHDPAYRTLVDMMEHMIHQAQYSTSEMREAAVMASLHYEMRTCRAMVRYSDGRIEEPPGVKAAIKTLQDWRMGHA